MRSDRPERIERHAIRSRSAGTPVKIRTIGATRRSAQNERPSRSKKMSTTAVAAAFGRVRRNRSDVRR
ncbi:MAG: hypothetical protein D6725_16515 [Planctomycetota bacterium]|nr:MAG: hypothetical protein D6725_16515 [Planctomycetota bacterium]